MLLVSWQEFPPMARVATPYLKLAGARIEIANDSKHDTPGGYGVTPCARSFELVAVPGGAATHVTLPAGACPARPYWSADGKRFAFANTARDAVELWIGDAATGALRQVPGVRLNPMFDGEMTTTLQSQKLYEAIRGNGGTARLVMLPHEPHWYSAMESQEQQIYELVRWFDLYVKNAAPKTAPVAGK